MVWFNLLKCSYWALLDRGWCSDRQATVWKVKRLQIRSSQRRIFRRLQKRRPSMFVHCINFGKPRSSGLLISVCTIDNHGSTRCLIFSSFSRRNTINRRTPPLTWGQGAGNVNCGELKGFSKCRPYNRVNGLSATEPTSVSLHFEFHE